MRSTELFIYRSCSSVALSAMLGLLACGAADSTDAGSVGSETSGFAGGEGLTAEATGGVGNDVLNAGGTASGSSAALGVTGGSAPSEAATGGVGSAGNAAGGLSGFGASSGGTSNAAGSSASGGRFGGGLDGSGTGATSIGGASTGGRSGGELATGGEASGGESDGGAADGGASSGSDGGAGRGSDGSAGRGSDGSAESGSDGSAESGSDGAGGASVPGTGGSFTGGSAAGGSAAGGSAAGGSAAGGSSMGGTAAGGNEGGGQSSGGTGTGGTGTGGTPASEPVTIYLAGDSTVLEYTDTPSTTDQAGWGQMLHELFTDKVTVVNRASGGRTALWFYLEGAAGKILDEIQPGDYFFVQFGTNDSNQTAQFEVNGVTYDRYANPSTDFKTYLKDYYLDPTRAAGAIPVLVTPPPRNSAYCGTGNSLGAHAQAMRELGEVEGVTVLDLNDKTFTYLSAICPSPTPEDFFAFRSDGSVDGTHFQENGARIMAGFIGECIVETDLGLESYLLP